MHLLKNGVLAALLLATSALAVDLVELKDGRVLEVDKAKLQGDKLYVELHLPGKNQLIGYTIKVEKVVPEFVFYVWLESLNPKKPEAHKDLAQWARKRGLFRHAWKAYEIAAASDPGFKAGLEKLKKTMHEEEATWNFNEAYRLFKENDVKAARVRVERVLEEFADTEETGRAKELLNVIKEREQFLSEQKRQDEIARRSRKHRRTMDKYLDRIRKADRHVQRARLKYTADAKRRLTWAAYAYRKAALAYAELLLIVEVDDLRFLLKGLLEDLDTRLVRTFLKLGDLRYLTGDTAGALDAAHEVLAISPGHKEAKNLRARVLDRGSGVGDLRGDTYSYRIPSYVRRYGLIHGHGLRTRFGGVHVGHHRPHAYPYPTRVYGVGLYYCR